MNEACPICGGPMGQLSHDGMVVEGCERDHPLVFLDEHGPVVLHGPSRVDDLRARVRALRPPLGHRCHQEINDVIDTVLVAIDDLAA